MAKLAMIMICSTMLLSSCVKNVTQGKNMSHNKNDTAINNFLLRDTSCMQNINILKRNTIDDFDMGEGICFSNSSYTEFLFMVKEMGGYENQYSYFYLLDSVPHAYDEKVIKLSEANFVTSLGLYLGCPKEEFIKMTKGKEFEVNNINDGILYSYTDSTELYSCKYIFQNNRLRQIVFGYIW